MNINVSVGDDLAPEVESWEDGKEYMLKVRQDSAGNFTALEASTPEMEESNEDETGEEETSSEMGLPTPKGNPAIAILMAKRGGKK